MKQLLAWLKANLPLVAVLLIGVIIAIANIQLHSTYTGWDNLNGELDLWRYTKQVWGGAWLEHQGLGAPMNLAHMAEIPRLPILWLLSVLLPDKLIRITFIFLMYLAGGITMYFYLLKIWLNGKLDRQKQWLAALGSLLYMLHILTLQQFYIAFEMFVDQFAFLPLLLLTLHRFAKPITAKTLLMFAGVQLLLAPSAHTPTNFYLATLFSLVYVFFMLLPKGWLKALKTAVLVGLLTLAANFYWIAPNIYYTLQNAHYVQESHDNQVFATESIASIREAGTLSNFLQNKQYLFNWKDYSFSEGKHVFIFDEWQSHLEQPVVIVILSSITLLTLMGIFTTAWDKRKGNHRYAVIVTYLACASFIWMGFLPTSWFYDLLYKYSETFTEIFRNPFTKLSIIFSVVSVLLFISSIEFLLSKIDNFSHKQLVKSLKISLTALTIGAIIYSAWPSFQGHFINDRLQTQIPEQYQELFNYLKTQDQSLRILPLPQTNHAGWEYYDWQFLGTDNGYQGMGFYFFGMPQPVLHRDTDRWIETSDFFYHQLKFALDSQDTELFTNVTRQYGVDLILIDETRIEPNQQINFPLQHQLAQQAGFTLVWQDDFLSLYRLDQHPIPGLVSAPTEFIEISAPATRTVVDPIYAEYGNYIETDPAAIIFPFEELNRKEITGLKFTNDSVSYNNSVSLEKNSQSVLEIPGWQNQAIPVALSRQNNLVTFDFPKTELLIGAKKVSLPGIADQSFLVEVNDGQEMMIIINGRAVVLANHQTLHRTIELNPGDSEIKVGVVTNPAGIPRTSGGEIDGTQLEIASLGGINIPSSFWLTHQLPLAPVDQLMVTTYFPVLLVDPMEEESSNCGQPIRGEISTHQNLLTQNIIYTASGYGVNCNGVTLKNIGTNVDYVFHLAGGNLYGRGLKFFIHRGDALIDDAVFAESYFDTSLTLHALSQVEIAPTVVTWEVRSHGQEVESELDQMAVGFLPLSQLAQSKIISLTNDGLSQSNQLTILENRSNQSSITLLTQCDGPKCLVALDQSYDPAWIALARPADANWWQLHLVDHYRYNGWANAWKIPCEEQAGENNPDCAYHVYIFYWPQRLAWAGLGALMFSIGALTYYALRVSERPDFNQPQRDSQLSKKVKRFLAP